MKLIPNSKPQLKKADALKIVEKYKDKLKSKLILIGVRGYYAKSMGATDGNDSNLYDDAMIVVGNEYATFNANTDPSFVTKKGRELAKLNTGVHTFYKGKHKGQYNALRAFPEGVVWDCTRNGKPAKCSYINIHKGGINAASGDKVWSEGCQTIPVNQYNPFIELVYKEMIANGEKVVTYILIDNDELKAIVGS